MIRLTALITCKNEQLHIRECVESAREIADEIVVADSGSTDGTLDIVRSVGDCRLIQREFISYADFKNWAIPQCEGDWILILDADERVTPELKEEIHTLLRREPKEDAFWIRRTNFFLGHRIRHCGWSNDAVVRLIRKDVCRYHPRPVHEAMNVPSGKIGKLKSSMRHFTAWDIEQFVAKQSNYAMRGAVHMVRNGATPNLLWAFVHSPLRFVQLYFFRLGILDGFAGLAVCGITAFYTFLKDINVWGIHSLRNPPEGFPAPLSRIAPTEAPLTVVPRAA